MKSHTLAQHIRRQLPRVRIEVPERPDAALAAVRKHGFTDAPSMLALAVIRGAEVPGDDLRTVEDPGKEAIPTHILIAALLSMEAPFDPRMILAGGHLIGFVRGANAQGDLVLACGASRSFPVLFRVLYPLIGQPYARRWTAVWKELRRMDERGRKEADWTHILPPVFKEMQAFAQRHYDRKRRT